MAPRVWITSVTQAKRRWGGCSAVRLCSRTTPNRRSGAVRGRDHAHPARRGLHPEAPAFEVARHRPAARRRLPGLLLRVLPGLADRWRHLARPGRRERRDVRAWARRGAIRARQRRDIGPGRYRDVRATRRGRILRAWSGRLRRLRWRRGLLPDSNVPSAGGAHGMARFLLPRIHPRVAARGARRRDHRRGARVQVRRRRPDAGVHPGRRTDLAAGWCAGTRAPPAIAFG